MKVIVKSGEKDRMADQSIQNVEKIAESIKSKVRFLDAFEEIQLSKKSLGQYAISFSAACMATVAIMLSGKVIGITSNTIEWINNVEIAFIAIVVGSYSIFQALLADALFELLLKSENNLLDVSNKSFLRTTLMYMFGIILNGVATIILNALPESFVWPQNIHIANTLAVCGLMAYLMFSFLLLLELKNFIVNLYQMFNMYNVFKALKIIAESEDEEDSQE